MKKIIIKIIIMLALLIGAISQNNIVCHAEAENPTYSINYPGGILVEFYGTITPSGKFYYGYSLDTTRDITINGYAKITFRNGKIDTNNYMYLSVVDKTDLSEDDDVALNLVIASNKQVVSAIGDDDFIYTFNIPINIKVDRISFNPDLISETKNGTLFTVKRNSNGTYNEVTNLRFLNSEGEYVDGNVFYDKYYSKVGKSKVTYTFYPNEVSKVPKQYNTIRGYIYVDNQPTVEAVKITSTTIRLSNNQNLEYRLSWKKTWQDSSYFKNLKPNTTYTFYVRVKNDITGYYGNPIRIKVTTNKE